ncbi:hypothetical protein [Streptomyces sp. NPDC007172]|uniref:hypothetical protein n=1 Tax=Streptomyces sp. NPDC007172 TaxID=3364776 RepID=UPI003695BE3B
MTDATGVRRPDTDWEYAVSAADQLMLWHAQVAPYTAQEPLRTRSVVLLAACLSNRAQAGQLTGPDVTQVQLPEAATVLEHYALQACPAPPGTGDEQRDYLVAAFGTDAFQSVAATPSTRPSPTTCRPPGRTHGSPTAAVISRPWSGSVRTWPASEPPLRARLRR